MGFIENCKRILRIATKPTRSDFWLSVKISILGMSVLGAIGFVIRLIAIVLIR